MGKMIKAATVIMAFITLIFVSGAVWAEEEAPEASAVSGAVLAEKEAPEASADIGVFSKYVWRGYELSDDSIVIQPSITVTYKDVSLNLWGNLDTDVDDDRNESNFNETDMTLSYAKSFGLVSFDVGYIYYGLDAEYDSEELYLSVGLDTFLCPTITVYREIAHWPCWYINLGISHSVELPKGITLDLSGSVGYYSSDDDDFTDFDSDLVPTDKKYDNFHDGLLSASLTIPVDKYITISPMIAYSFPLTDDADDHIAGTNGFSDDSDYFLGGVTVSIAF